MLFLNRFLNAINLLLAIAACTAAFYLNKRRVELRERADILATKLVDTVVALEGDPNSPTWFGTSHKDSITEDKLNWEAYHTDKAGLLENLNKTDELARDLTTHKEQLAKDIIRIANTMENPFKSEDETNANLNSVGQIEQEIKLIDAHFKAMRERENKIITEIALISETIKKPIVATDLSDINNLQDGSYSTPLDKLKRNTKSLYERCNALADTLKKAIEAAPKHEWTADANELASEDAYMNSTDSFITDVGKFNGKLDELAKTLERNEELVVKTEELELNLETATQEVSDLKNEVGKHLASINRLEKQLEEIVGTSEDTNMPADLIAEIVEIDNNFDFVVLNKGDVDKVKKNGEMLIHNNGTYVCKIKITRVLKNKSIAEVLDVTRKSTPTIGNLAIVAK